MARDYQSLLDFANAPVSPETQALTGQQPTPQPQPQESGSGLLDVLSAIGSGLGTVGGALGTGLLETLSRLPEVAAYRQAALGNAEPLKLIQEQKQQKQAMESLQGADFGELTPQIQQALKVGGPKAAQKIALQAPAFRSIQDMLKDSSLTPEYKKAIANAALIDPEKALDLYGRVVSLKETEARIRGTQEAVTGRQREALSRREAAAEKTVARKEQTKAQAEPGNLLRAAIDLKILDPADPEFSSKALGYLRDKGISLPSNPEAQDKFMEQLLKSPRLPKTPDFADRIKAFFGFGVSKAAPVPTQAPTGVRKFNPATGQLE